MNISAYRADYLPLLGQLMNQMKLPQIINEAVTKPNSQAIVDAGTMISGMILNLLSDAKIRLYRLSHFFEDKPMPLIFPWKPDIVPSNFTEERSGNVLDEFYRSNPQKIFSMLTHSNIKLYNINTNSIRVDTTSKSFYGVYETNMPEPIDITQGFSKDKRHDLKQIMFGTATSSDGIPILGEVMSGNTSDMTFNKGWIKTVRQALQKSDDDFLLYTADSAAVTEENLKLFKEYHVDMISRLPERYGLAEELINQAITANIWTEIGTLSEGKKAATYKSISFERELYGDVYRFVVFHSSSLDKRKLKTLNSKIEKEKLELIKKAQEESKREFFCEADARAEIDKFQKENKSKFHTITSEIIEVEKTIKRNKRGRLKNGEIPLKERRFLVKFEPGQDVTACNLEQERCGLFVLITTLKDMEKYPDREILYQYKGQQAVENIFKFIKDPTLVGAYCLKNPERIVAFGYILLMAAQVYTILERVVRKNLENPDEEPVEGLNRQKTKRPTAYAIEYVLSAILVMRVQKKKCEEWILSKELDKNQKRILNLAGFDERIYCKSMRTIN
jgi:transposase